MNLAELTETLPPASVERVQVFVSRLAIACNTVAARLAEAASSPTLAQVGVMLDAADVLWGIGEKAAEQDAAYFGADDARPPQSSRQRCLREPIPEVFEAAMRLSAAVDAHLAGNREEAAALIRAADDPAVYAWTDSIWGKQSPEIHRFRLVDGAPPRLPVEARPRPRMPTQAIRREVLARDGYHCRFCGIPVIAPNARKALLTVYPDAARWGRRNIEQHAAIQCLWLQFDHVVPNQRGGDSSAANVVITCAPCNFGRMEHTVEEAGLLDPRVVTPSTPGGLNVAWDGLERLVGASRRR